MIGTHAIQSRPLLLHVLLHCGKKLSCINPSFRVVQPLQHTLDCNVRIVSGDLALLQKLGDLRVTSGQPHRRLFPSPSCWGHQSARHPHTRGSKLWETDLPPAYTGLSNYSTLQPWPPKFVNSNSPQFAHRRWWILGVQWEVWDVVAEELQPRVWWCFRYEQDNLANLQSRSKSLPHLGTEPYPDSNYVTATRMSGAKLHHAVAEQNTTLQFYEKQGDPKPTSVSIATHTKNKKDHHHNISVPNCTDNACTLQLTHMPTQWCHCGQCRSARQSRHPYPGYTVATPICPKTRRSIWHEPHPDPNVWTQPPITSDSLTLFQRKAQPANFKQNRDPKRMSVWMATHTEHKKRPSSQHLGAKLDRQCLHTPINPHTQKVTALRAMPICEAISTPPTLDTL